MKLWVDDIRPAPDDFLAIQSVNGAIAQICVCEDLNIPIELIDIDHDAGIYYGCGGDYIKLLDWLEATGRSYPIHIHSMNPVGVQNMRAIIQKNNWKKVK